MSVQDLMGIN